jgi:hypothetical protein
MNHRVGRVIFSLSVGIVVAMFAYRWATNPEPRAARAQEEQVVLASRSLLASVVASDDLEIVDPLAPNRKIGKAYVYAENPGWAVSGYYRRGADDRWHPYLLTMTDSRELVLLKVQDKALVNIANRDPKLVITD